MTKAVESRLGEIWDYTNGIHLPYGCHANGDTYCLDHCPDPDVCEDEHSAILWPHESDTPEHCSVCYIMLPIGLTRDGEEYVKEHCTSPTISEVHGAWRRYYDYIWEDEDDNT